MKSHSGETQIVMMANGAPSERCLHFHPAAVPELDVERRLLVRGEVRSRVVRGYRSAGAPTKSVVFASPDLCEWITPGTGDEREFEACISAARWRDSIADLQRGTLGTLLVTVLVFLAGLGGAVGAFIGSSAPIGVAAAIAIVVAIGLAARALGDVQAALKIDCP